MIRNLFELWLLNRAREWLVFNRNLIICLLVLRYLLEKWGAGFFEASVTTGKNVKEIFIELVRLIDRYKQCYWECTLLILL